MSEKEHHEAAKSNMLRVVDREIQGSRLLIALNAGAITLIAAFFRTPPEVLGAKWYVASALALFLFSFLSSLYGLQNGMRSEALIDKPLDTLDQWKEARKENRLAAYLFLAAVVLMFMLALNMVLRWE